VGVPFALYIGLRLPHMRVFGSACAFLFSKLFKCSNVQNMKKNNLVLVFIIFTTVSLFFAGCSFEAIGEHQNHDENGVNTHFKKENVNFETFSKNPKLMGKLNKNKETLKSITSNKIISSTDHSFYINTNDALYIEDENGLHSYTFTINRNLENVFLENLVIQLQQDGTYKSFIVTYNITEQELEDLKNGTLSDINDKISLQVIDDENFTSGFANKILYEPCITGSSQTWKCSQGVLNHAPGNPGPPDCIAGSFDYVINVNWGICSVYTSDGDDVPDGTTGGNTGGGGTSSNSTGTIKTDVLISPDYLLLKDFVREFLDENEREWYSDQTDEIQIPIDTYLINNSFTLESKNFIKEIINSGLNQTLICVSPFFKYPLGSNYSELYPNFTILVKDYLPLLKSETRLTTTINKLTNVSILQIMKDLTWGNGPEIHITDLGNDPMGKPYYGKFNKNEPDRIYIDIDLVNQLETISNNPNPTSSETQLIGNLNSMIVFSVCLHEYVHFSDFAFDGSMQDNENLELGLLFEELFQGGYYDFNEEGGIVFIRKN
jgi:Metallopeptidase toxin 3